MGDTGEMHSFPSMALWIYSVWDFHGLIEALRAPPHRDVALPPEKELRQCSRGGRGHGRVLGWGF